jgi:hypothetical protein
LNDLPYSEDLKYWEEWARTEGSLADRLQVAKLERALAEQDAVWEAEQIAKQAAEAAAEAAKGVDTTLLDMDEDEQALLEVSAELMKLERYFHGRSSGFSVRIVRGLSYRVGESIGRRERDEDWSVVDIGDFTVTNKRVVFRGDEETFDFTVGSILGLDVPSDDELEIQAKRRKTMRFRFSSAGADEAATHITEAIDEQRFER